MKKRFLKFSCLLIVFSLFFYLPLVAKKAPIKINLKGFDQFVSQTMEEWKVPGLALVIVKDGQVILSKGYGFRDVEKKLKVTSKTLFAIGSCTKAFTATAMGILVDEGKLDWDKAVQEYIPAFKLKDEFASERMTPRDLVCHRSGLPRHDAMWYNSSASRKELFERLQYLEPSKDFRALFQYQNLMFMTAGYLVGQIEGSTWEEFVQKRLLQPLAMEDSNFSVEDSKKAPDFALPYMKKDDLIIEIPFRNIDTVGPAGSINSNLTDMAHWVLLNLKKGKHGEEQIISENALQEIHSPQMIASKSYEYEESFYSMYGMGWSISAYRGHHVLAHGGGIDGFIALVSFMPKDNIGMVIFTNLSGNPVPSIIAHNVYDRLLGLDQVDWNKRIKERVGKAKEEQEKTKKEKDKDRKLNTKPSHPLEDYAGDYEHPGYGVFSVVKESDQLKSSYNSLNFDMEHYHYDIFKIKNEFLEIDSKLSFFTDDKGNIGSLAVQLEPAVKEIVFARMPEKKMAEKSFLEKFVGEYVIGEITSTVVLKGEKTLFFSIPGQRDYELIPYKGTEFKVKDLTGYSVEFIIDESGVVIEAKIVQSNGVSTAKKK